MGGSRQQRAGRRRWPSGLNPAVSYRSSPSIYLAVIAPIISCCLSLATSSPAVPFAAQPAVAAAETLLIDSRVPVQVGGVWHMMSQEEHHLFSRDDDDSALPQPFEGALAANFSGANNGACPAFINEFLADSTFQSCYPLSLLMQSSYTFFEAQKSFVGITRVLDASCAADLDFCTDYLYDLGNRLISDDVCAEDYEDGNSVVVQSYMAFQAYETVYSSSCLTNAESSSYCFAEAVTDINSSDNARLYYLPLNISMSRADEFSCDTCTSQTMGIFQPATSNRSEYISNTYLSAAYQVNAACGTEFVNATLSDPVEGFARKTSDIALAPMFTIAMLATIFSRLLL